VPEPPLYPKPVPLNDTGHPDGAARIHNLPDEVKPVPPEEPPALPVSVALPAVVAVKPTDGLSADGPIHSHAASYSGFVTLAVGIALIVASESTYFKADHDVLINLAVPLIMAGGGLTGFGKSLAIK
jgi:hypothetical protein